MQENLLLNILNDYLTPNLSPYSHLTADGFWLCNLYFVCYMSKQSHMIWQEAMRGERVLISEVSET